MAPGVNAQIADALTARLLQIGRVTTGLRLDVWRQLAVLESDILALLKMSDPTDETLLRARRRAIEELMEQDLAPLITRRYGGLASLLTAALLRRGMAASHLDADTGQCHHEGRDAAGDALRDRPPPCSDRHAHSHATEAD
mgnify:CR=1 FL=1